MKRIIFSLLLAVLVVSACVSTDVADFHHATLADIQAKRRANAANQADIYNRWYYAGSDDKYDYIYEYQKGISVTPPKNFHYYKLDKGQLDNLPPSFPFNPQLGANPEIFTW